MKKAFKKTVSVKALADQLQKANEEWAAASRYADNHPDDKAAQDIESRYFKKMMTIENLLQTVTGLIVTSSSYDVVFYACLDDIEKDKPLQSFIYTE